MRPAGRIHLEVKVLYELGRGIVSRTARVSIVRWKPEEAAGKTPARRTEIAYEAIRLDEKANIFKVRYPHGKPGCICGGHKREGGCAIPGEVCESLLNGMYQPQGGRWVWKPKPNGGVRQPGIPTVPDRLIQQALHQVLSPIFEPNFSEPSYGFRPGRSAQQAVAQARVYVSEGRRWVVDVDVEKFFDRVNHDILMSRLARRISDKRVQGLIRQYLQAGMMMAGIVSARAEGSPQGGPLSPLPSNILLDELDKEQERRGQRFCRYADDCNIYVQSKGAGERVLKSVTEFLSKRLRLQVNAARSAVARPWERKFWGYSMKWHKQPRLKVAPESIQRLKAKIRTILRAG